MDADVKMEFDEIKGILKSHGAGFDKMDARLDNMDARFDNMDRRLDKMDARFDFQDEHAHAAGLREEQRDDMIKAIYDIVIAQAFDRERVKTTEDTLGDHELRIRALETVTRKDTKE